MDDVNTQGGGDEQQIVFGDTQRAAFDFGNGAAGGVVPAGKLQPDSEFLLRPAIAPAQFDNLLSNQVQLLHGNRFKISCDLICVVIV